MRRITAMLAVLGAVLLLPFQFAAGAEDQVPQYRQVAPDGAPNILIILLDDVGFGSASTFGGPVPTPGLDQLANEGLSYSRFHTTGICSPTRVSLLTGRNPHKAGIGAVMNAADLRRGYSGFHRKDTASIAEMLRQAGYSTAAVGKWHQTPDWEVSQAGPFDRWPTGEGFDYFYGVNGGETDQFQPTLYLGTTPVNRPAGDDYHFTQDLSDHSIAWLRQHRTMRPHSPFLLYYSTGAVHAPIQVPKPWIDRFKGQFDQGWDKLREETLERQKSMGLIPQNTVMAPRPEQLPAWDSLSADEKRFAAHAMEAYAGFLAHTDAQIARVLDELRASGEFDNTLVFYVVGDNGASLEGGPEGSLNYLAGLVGLPQNAADRIKRIDDFGTERAHSHINSAWAWANNAPYQWGKTMPAWLGAIRNPLVVSWPKVIDAKLAGKRRTQFGHVNDIAPTILDVLGMTMPDTVNGIDQLPMDGTSLLYSFASPKAPERHRMQYFEVFGSRSLYLDGWFAAADHGRLPWGSTDIFPKPVEQDQWRLFDLMSDPAQAKDLAEKEPKRLADMQAIFMEEAKRNDLLPLRGMALGRTGLPTIADGRRSITYLPGTRAMHENGLPAIANSSWTITAELDAGAGPSGVIAAVGGHSAGMGLWIDAESHVNFTYRLYDLQTLSLRSAEPLTAGSHTVVVDFAYDGGGYAKGGEMSLRIDGNERTSGRLVASVVHMFTIDETFDLGLDRGSPVADYPAEGGIGFPIRGASIKSVTVALPVK